MFVIYGSGTKVEKWQYIGRRFCRSCSDFTNFYIGRKISYYSLFFIPIVKIPKAYYVMCNTCDIGFELTKEQAIALRKDFEHLPTPEHITLLLTYIVDKAKESNLDDKGKETIFNYAKAHFGIRENEEYVKNLIDDVFEVERGRSVL
ncbi:zinc-ribbon domain-containing protein [Amedibacillus sp. YH-ame10]